MQNKLSKDSAANMEDFHISDDAIASRFPYILPRSRLGVEMPSLEAFRKATKGHESTKTKEFSLVVATESSRQRILQGLKHRGFGKGLYNSFGGKLEPRESRVQCACRELKEETGIAVPEDHMAQCLVGVMHFTFDDEETEMVVRVYHVDVDTCGKEEVGATTKSVLVDTNAICGCEEITPTWIENWFDIPLANMFADDSLWLTRLILAYSEGKQVNIDGWYHFHPGGQQINSIRHYYMNIRPKRKSSALRQQNDMAEQESSSPLTLEKRLFHALHDNQIHSPSIKEFKEAFAFINAVKSCFRKQSFDVVIDVAGGHGALAALLLITTNAKRGVVIDPAQVGSDGVKRAWKKNFLPHKQLEYRHEDLRTGLPAELHQILLASAPERVLVVACHACQHLSEEILEIVCTKFRGVHAAVMPCCQKDRTGSWKSTSKNLDIPIAKVMDLLLAGKVMSWPSETFSQNGKKKQIYDYDVRMKLIDSTITPQNRVILCRAVPLQTGTSNNGISTVSASKKRLDKAHQKLAATYAKAHVQCTKRIGSDASWFLSKFGGSCLAIGLASGFLLAKMTNCRH